MLVRAVFKITENTVDFIPQYSLHDKMAVLNWTRHFLSCLLVKRQFNDRICDTQIYKLPDPDFLNYFILPVTGINQEQHLIVIAAQDK
jgi:hypothetical protein